MTQARQGIVEHFEARAERYNRSSHWVSDESMGRRVAELLALEPGCRLLDVACGTGLWARNFKDAVGELIGLDLTPGMYAQAGGNVDRLVVGSAEAMPFEDGTFDRVIERQGIQFMDAVRAVGEMVRVCRPGGLVCLAQLCAYGDVDRDEYFRILELRNPARRNFFVRQDLRRLLLNAGCREAVVHDWISVEDVEAWADNGAIGADNQQGIQAVYAGASEGFSRLHAVTSEASRIHDHMLFGIAVGVKTR